MVNSGVTGVGAPVEGTPAGYSDASGTASGNTGTGAVVLALTVSPHAGRVSAACSHACCPAYQIATQVPCRPATAYRRPATALSDQSAMSSVPPLVIGSVINGASSAGWVRRKTKLLGCAGTSWHGFPPPGQ